jgi:hypothetical protein
LTAPPRPDAWAMHDSAEHRRMREDEARTANWRRWGPWLPDRQWGTVREDYSADGTCWSYLPHDHARSRAYRWGEDGILGITDRQCRLCLAPALWNGRDPILKERLFGLTGDEGNHGEDVKECWWHLDATPTASYLRGLYRYPMAAFPYAELVERNRGRSRALPEYELEDTGVLDDGRFWDLEVELAKDGPDDLVWRMTAHNRSAAAAELHLLPQVWFRNTWAWGCRHEGCGMKPRIHRRPDGHLGRWHESLGSWVLSCDGAPEWLFTGNETNHQRLWGTENPTRWVKDAIHRRVVDDEVAAVDPATRGTKAAAWYRLAVPAGGAATVTMRLRPESMGPGDPAAADTIIAARRAEADAYYAAVIPPATAPEPARVARLAYAGLVWSHRFYHLIVEDWLRGDPEQPAPPASRKHGRNADWGHLYNRDVLALPDPWEYPWYASWDLAFHAVAMAPADLPGAKRQIELLLREWYMHPNGQIPAYEFAFGDVNPPVHAWAAWRLYRQGQAAGEADLGFLERVFQKLLLNFTWWVNRKDPHGRNLFAGGFLGLDNIGPFDRSKPPPGGWSLEQADGTAWMAFFAGRMLTIALELARHRPAYEDIASKFLEHLVAISHAINGGDGEGLWHEEDGFYYDHLRNPGGERRALRLHSMVGIVPLFAGAVISRDTLAALPGFAARLAWFRRYRPDPARAIDVCDQGDDGTLLVSIADRTRLARILARVADPEEFWSPHGVRSLSRFHRDRPFTVDVGGDPLRVAYTPGESVDGLFGGNSNWRGPVWFPLNILLIESLERFHGIYGSGFRIPRRDGGSTDCLGLARELSGNLASLMLPGADGLRPWQGGHPRWRDPLWRDLAWFHEYFHGDDGRGLGASHQTGWTALVAGLLAGRTQRASTVTG